MLQYKKGMIIVHPDEQTGLRRYGGSAQRRDVLYSVAGHDIQVDQGPRKRRYQRGLIIVAPVNGTHLA